jgi:hypothetical protein
VSSIQSLQAARHRRLKARALHPTHWLQVPCPTALIQVRSSTDLQIRLPQAHIGQNMSTLLKLLQLSVGKASWRTSLVSSLNLLLESGKFIRAVSRKRKTLTLLVMCSYSMTSSENQGKSWRKMEAGVVQSRKTLRPQINPQLIGNPLHAAQKRSRRLSDRA